MKKSTAATLVLAATLSAATVSAYAYTGSQYAHGARISMARARTIALEAMPGGKIVGEELEPERGGSGLRYSFDVKYKGLTYEVGIDAATGKVLEKAAEGTNPD